MRILTYDQFAQENSISTALVRKRIEKGKIHPVNLGKRTMRILVDEGAPLTTEYRKQTAYVLGVSSNKMRELVTRGLIRERHVKNGKQIDRTCDLTQLCKLKENRAATRKLASSHKT